MSEHSLPRCYMDVVPDVRVLPMYLHLDDPGTAAIRARLRFRRAHLNYNRVRMNYSDTNGICTHCDMGVYETTTHLLCVCPCYESARMDCIMSLAVLTPPQHLTTLIVLSGPPSCPSHVSRQVNTITGVYINALQRARLF